MPDPQYHPHFLRERVQKVGLFREEDGFYLSHPALPFSHPLTDPPLIPIF